ncbi:hypothetical protein PBY51_018015 [Eleginops maclovinus]|uniref:Uncharacterized protein n=1 Tax=Eleginops maclovinus TaxID=56733 RepID=A0AAN7XKV6_ELEMC|nr:hypothetical protein PBY51_018015 [Eleginops maclovinus]
MCPLSVPLALCSARNQKEYDCTPRSDPPQLHHGALNTPLLFTLLRWPLTPGDVSERSWGERLSVDGGSGVKRVLGNE